MQSYLAYGTGIESDFPFGALPVSDVIPAIHFQVTRSPILPDPPDDLTKLCQSQGRNIYVRVTGNRILVRIGGFANFDLRPADGLIVCRCLTIVPDELLRYWFIQQILPLYLLWNATAEFLHGMAVSVNAGVSGSMGFLGDSHAGKSTLLNFFLSRDHTLVSDDHLAISRGNYLDVLPATPYYRPYRAGEDLGHVADNFSPAPTPLKRLYLLEPTFAYADIEVIELQGVKAIEALLPHIQYNLHNPGLPQLFPLVAERFTGLNRLIRQVPVKRLHVPRDLNRLPEVYDFIQNDLASRPQ